MNKYASLDEEAQKKRLEGFLIDHWSVSAVTSFITNEKAFEMKYIYKEYDKEKSLSAIIGNVYHDTIKEYFRTFASGERLSFDALAMIAHAKLDGVGADEYKPQKKLTIIEQQLEALKRVNFALETFLSEVDAYTSTIKEVIFVEQMFKEYVSINGIDIPLPLKIVPDVVFIDHEGCMCVLDHKTVKAYTEENDVIKKHSNQAITYTLGLNEFAKRNPALFKKWPKAKLGVKKFFYFENKYTKNKDGSRQIKQIPIDIKESGPLFEQILFEGVFRMIEAVQNPDHPYLMNPYDFQSNGKKLLEFWVKTHISGLEGFPNLTPSQREILKKRRSMVRRAALTSIPKSVIRSFTDPKDFVSLTLENMENLTIPERIEHRLKTFGYPVKVEHAIEGYSCDTYLLQIGAGLKSAQIYGYRMDIANAVGAKDVRINKNLIEYNGSAYVAIEVNRKETRALKVSEADLQEGPVFPIGKDNYGNTISWSLLNPSTPHMMVAGAAGSGKSVAISNIVEVALQKGMPVIILDPKYEFTHYSDKCEVYNELAHIEAYMELAVGEMDGIFKAKGASGNSKNKRLIIFDEAADCLIRQTKERVSYEYTETGKERKVVDRTFKTLEENVLIIAQKARSAGMHLVLAAQRFSAKVLTGDAKANFTTRLCLTVASGVDSKVMLDQEGAEKLNGKGDALITSPELSEPVRIQCFMP